MQKIGICILIFFFINSLFLCKNKSFIVKPEKPKAGDEVKIIYNPAGTLLEDSGKIEMTVYFNSRNRTENHIKSCYSFEMEKKGGSWTASFKIDPFSDFSALKFSNEKYSDNNEGKGYFIRLYDSNGNETPGSIMGYASFISSWGSRLGIVEKDTKKAYAIMSGIFLSNPELKYYYYSDYLSLISQFGKNENSLLLKELEEFSKCSNLIEDDYIVIDNFYLSLKKDTKAKEIETKIYSLYPKGRLAFHNIRMKALQSEQDLSKKMDLARNIEKDYTGSVYTGKASFAVFEELAAKGRSELLKEWWNYITASGNIKPNFYVSYAQLLINTKKEYSFALTIAQEGVNAWRSEFASPSLERPSNKTEIEFAKSNNSKYADLLFTNGKILNLLYRNEEAVNIFEAAFSIKPLNQYNPDDVEGYIKCMADCKKYDVVMALLKNAFQAGKYTITMKTLMKDVYIKQNGSDEGYEKYRSEIETASKSNMIDELRQKMFNKPAFQFSLKNPAGETINLSDYKGKIVILDFWATWCGFCIQSFPDMKRAVSKYSNDNDVIFLFIDTMEKMEDKAGAVNKFLTEHNYQFITALDTDGNAAHNYGVSSIPAKIFIDKKGKWRFTSMGYDKDKILDEIDGIIDLLK